MTIDIWVALKAEKLYQFNKISIIAFIKILIINFKTFAFCFFQMGFYQMRLK
jgi:hypothetical protein